MSGTSAAQSIIPAAASSSGDSEGVAGILICRAAGCCCLTSRALLPGPGRPPFAMGFTTTPTLDLARILMQTRTPATTANKMTPAAVPATSGTGDGAGAPPAAAPMTGYGCTTTATCAAVGADQPAAERALAIFEASSEADAASALLRDAAAALLPSVTCTSRETEPVPLRRRRRRCAAGKESPAKSGLT